MLVEPSSGGKPTRITLLKHYSPTCSLAACDWTVSAIWGSSAPQPRAMWLGLCLGLWQKIGLVRHEPTLSIYLIIFACSL